MSKEVYIITELKIKDHKTYVEQYALKFKDLLPKYQGIFIPLLSSPADK